MLANGPACTITGVSSSVCVRCVMMSESRVLQGAQRHTQRLRPANGPACTITGVSSSVCAAPDPKICHDHRV